MFHWIWHSKLFLFTLVQFTVFFRSMFWPGFGEGKCSCVYRIIYIDIHLWLGTDHILLSSYIYLLTICVHLCVGVFAVSKQVWCTSIYCKHKIFFHFVVSTEFVHYLNAWMTTFDEGPRKLLDLLMCCKYRLRTLQNPGLVIWYI